MEKVVLIMAGGRGERFWPKSRRSLPKQFLSLTFDGKTMIQLTVERILPLVPLDRIFVATNREYVALVKEQLPELRSENIIAEPIGKNTAPCISLAAALIEKRFANSMMIVLPADHQIKYVSLFHNALENACQKAEEGENLVTIGITPSYPETGYGYIKFQPGEHKDLVLAVEHFVEKPSLELAKAYLASNSYLWNSGMFVWGVRTILTFLENHAPDMYAGVKEIADAYGTPDYEATLESIYSGLTAISIDYAILEKAENIYTVPGSFGWDDVGSWLALERISPPNDEGNLLAGNVVTVDTSDCIIEASDKLIATVGLSNIIVVDTPDATLVCEKSKANDIKKILAILRERNRTEYI